MYWLGFKTISFNLSKMFRFLNNKLEKMVLESNSTESRSYVPCLHRNQRESGGSTGRNGHGLRGHRHVTLPLLLQLN